MYHDQSPPFGQSTPRYILDSAPAGASSLPPGSTTSVIAGQVAESGNEATKKKRRKVNHACLYCRRSHMTCDDGRPCQRCIKRDIGHLCRDEAKPVAGSPVKANPTPGNGLPGGTTTLLQQQQQQAQSLQSSAYPYSVASTSTSHHQQPTPSTPAPWSLMQQNTSGQWGSETLGNEFSVLTEFLEALDDRSFFSSAGPNAGSNVPMNIDPSPQQHQLNQGYPSNTLHHQQSHDSLRRQSHPLPPPHTLSHHSSLPPSLGSTSSLTSSSTVGSGSTLTQDQSYAALNNAVSKTEQFFMMAADPLAGTRDERLAKVIRAKYEAGLLKPYNYGIGYKRLMEWMDRNVTPESRIQIQQILAVLQPKFRAVAQNLTDIDLIFVEELFERLLLDYDRVFSAMGIPACLWRRTGEIYKGNREFASLIGVKVEDLMEGKMAIYELMFEESAINFWEKYANVAFDQNQKAVLTSCVLRYKPREANTLAIANTPLQEGYVNCCFSFTIRRDNWGIPIAVVGNFISY